MGSARDRLSLFSVFSHSFCHFDHASDDYGVRFDQWSRWRCQVDGPGSAEEDVVEADRRRALCPVLLARAELHREADRGRAHCPVSVRNC